MTTISPVELGVLGPLQVRQHGLPVAVPGAKPRAVLTMLGLNGGSVVSADTLAELLWGARPPRTAVKALQTHISSLRRALGDGFVLTEGSGWTLSTTDIDATRYKLAARLGREAIAAGDAAQAVTRFDEALALWRGIPELPDGPRAASEKTRWIEGHAALVEDRADALLATGRAAEIVGELEAAIADAPLRERRWGQLMLALYRAGRQGEALAAYQRARSLLADELGVDPGPNLRRLESAIVAQDAALEIPVSQQLSIVTKAVTFLLTDIEGSTAAWEAQADAMAVALARHDEIVEQVVTSRGGRLVKTRGEGDATFSVFDRPSSAAAAAIELQEAIRHEPWALANPMRIRISLHTGEVELRDGDYFGRAVNRAARLRSLASGGQILCSGATGELVIDTLADDVVLADLGMRQLKNLARPEHVFELRLEAVEDSGTPVAEVPMHRPSLPAVLTGPGPFVGRGEELAGLLTAWQSTLTVGTRAVLVAGEPGVGKTRLAGEWSRQVYEEGAVVLYGRCDEDLGAAYQPFAEALRSLVPCLGADRLRGLRGVEALLPLVPGLTDIVPDLPTPSRSDPDTERYALFDAVVALMGAASTSAPVVLILDDLHWAAKPTLLLLRHLLRFGEQARVQIVGTYRSTDLDRSHPLAAMLTDLHRDGSAIRLALTGLDEKDVSAYVSEAGYNDDELARALASVTGGNPFFLIEALRHVDESGGRWDPNTLPQGVREAVSRRLSRLPAETNKALAAAAVVGSRFAVDLVERVVDGDLVDAFDEACKAGIVIEEPGGRYRFNHALVRQSLLAELPSVRRMRLHQRIAVTLESESTVDDDLLAELAYHYFECAWAGNAAKAVEYCQRAADQAMARLAYEGAADLYDRALHALEELDDELPDRDALQAELLVARCEALLAAGDVGSAAGAVAQLQQAAGDSVRLAAWGTCFDGELSMLTNPERLDEIEAAVGAAAEKLAGLEDAAGEAKAHTVRAMCLARLGRIGDAETALDQALTAARRAHDHRRVNAVLAGAPLAALWGPNPVPRAGGRCLDVVRLLRITTGSPVVEATSTRCQGVLDALRGRAAAGRALIDSARRSLTELGMRHALLEVEQFAGLVELVANEPAAAEPLLRRACDGFRRMGLDADTAETAAFLAKACLALGRDAEADELCVESERLAGHALKPSITWRTVRAQLLARRGAHAEARRIAEEAVSIAERTDALVDHGDACLTLAVVLNIAGDVAGARAAADQAIALFERKGAAALVELAHSIVGSDISVARSQPETPVAEADNECVRTLRRVDAAVQAAAWDEFEREYAPAGSIESRQKIVGFGSRDYRPSEFVEQTSDFGRGLGARHLRREVVATRGERLALTTLKVGTGDTSPGAPQVEMLQLVSLDEEGRIALQIWFDVEDIDAAIAELDALHRQFGVDNACVRTIRRLDAAFDANAWEEVQQLVASTVSVESRRKTVGMPLTHLPLSAWVRGARSYRDIAAHFQNSAILAVRGERLALTRVQIDTADRSPGAPRDDMLMLFGLDERGFIALQVWFDIDDLDAAIAELDAQHAQFEGGSTSPKENMASRVYERIKDHFSKRQMNAIGELLADDVSSDDRRKVVNAGVQRGRNACLSEFSGIAEVGVRVWRSDVIALRGEYLVMNRVRVASDGRSNAFSAELLDIVEVDADGRVKTRIVLDTDDFEIGLAELDARYLAGEAAAHAQVWRCAMDTLGEVNRHESGPMLSRLTYVDHRRVSFGSADFGRAVEELWMLVPDARYRATSVHALDAHGTVASLVIEGTDSEGNELQWYRIVVLLPDESRMEVYDDDDLNAALAYFEAVRPTTHLENAASRADAQFNALFGDGRFDDIAPLFIDDLRVEDRRRGLYRVGVGRAAELAEVRTIASLGTKSMTSHVIAIRGERLALVRTRYSGRDQRPEAFHTEVLRIAEVDGDNKIMAYFAFDLDAMDAAMTELEARYLAGEAAAHEHTWTVIAAGYAGLNRRETPATTPDWVNIDHRRGTRFASGDLVPFIHASWDDTQNNRLYVRAVHRLSDDGALVASATSATSRDGFDAEWQEFCILMLDGDKYCRVEVFDESDLDRALARFDELSPRVQRLDNAANRVLSDYHSHFATREWDVMARMLADEFSADDRRRVVVAHRRGREAEITNFQVVAELGCANITSTPLATRGERLVLAHHALTGSGPEPFEAELVDVVEIDSRNRIVNVTMFDADQFDEAVAELDARYLAGEAAECAQTWSVVTGVFDALNRHEVPAATPDWVHVDHRRGTPLADADLTAIVRSLNELTPGLRNHVESVDRLHGQGALFTQVSRGTSPEGFDAEWRIVNLLTVEGDMVSRCELFDESQLDIALTRFEELTRPTPALENAASRVVERFNAHFAARDWDAVAKVLAEDVCDDDRRRVVSSGVQRGRNAQIANLRAVVDLGMGSFEPVVIATRGERLVLTHTQVTGGGHGADKFGLEPFTIAEINADGQIALTVHVDDRDAAFEVLENRYLAGEAAEHAHTWTVVAGVFGAYNRREQPAVSPDWVNIDHRRAAAFAAGDLIAFMSASWADTPDVTIYIEAVHRLGDVGAVVTWAGHGTSPDGFEAEWRASVLVTVDGDFVNRCEMFDTADLDAAVARFDELSVPSTRPENAASQFWLRLNQQFTSGDWAAISQSLSQNMIDDDRRRPVNAGTRTGRDVHISNARAVAETGTDKMTSTLIALRGERLALCRSSFFGGDQLPEAYRVEFLSVVEIGADGLLTTHVGLDSDDLDAAFSELDTRYMAGEAAAYADTWSVIARAYNAVMRHELPPWTTDAVNVDHRSATAFAPGELSPYLHAMWDQTPDERFYIESVHRLTSSGAVVTHVASGTSQQGFEGEWREVTLSMIDGDRINRSELFDEADLDAALARFDELSRTTLELANTASQISNRFDACFAGRDWTGMAALLAEDMRNDDRRRVIGSGIRTGRDAEIAQMQAIVDLGVRSATSVVVATRGERLALLRTRFSGPDPRPEAFHTDIIDIVEVDIDGRIAQRIAFDVDDIDAAFEQLDVRYLAGEAAAHARTWSVIVDGCSALNRQTLPATTLEFDYADRRRIASVGTGDMREFFRAAWEITPDMVTHVEAVHRLNDRGAVVTQRAHGNSDDGFYAEWRVANVYMVEGELLSRCEVFDEADLDAAFARFDELSRRASTRVVNMASKVCQRYRASFAARDWDAARDILANDLHNEDRRRVVNAGIRSGRDSALHDLRAAADLGVPEFTASEIASRGERLALFRGGAAYDERSGAFHVDVLQLAKIDGDGRIAALVTFDPDAVDAAFAELDARYLAGEAAAHVRTWSAIAEGYAAFNRREMPKTTPDWLNIDHRTGGSAFAPGDQTSYIHATWEVAPQVRSHATVVHRLSDLGAVVTQVTSGTSHQGFDVEWQDIILFTVEGDLLSRCEVFNDANLDAALERFDELTAQAPRLGNAASKAYKRYNAHFVARDWDAMAELVADDVRTDDRRRVISGGVQSGRAAQAADMRAVAGVGVKSIESLVIATRGDRLALIRARVAGDERPDAFGIELLIVVGIDGDGRLVGGVLFDLEDIDAAFTELDERYLAGDAAPHAEVWRVVAEGYAALNRQELPPTSNWSAVDHRVQKTFTGNDLTAYICSGWDVVPGGENYIEQVHKLSNVGALVTHAAYGTSPEGFDAEWRMIALLSFGDTINRVELFDVSDLDVAAGKFEKLCRQDRELDNTSTRMWTLLAEAFHRRDVRTFVDLTDPDGYLDDRRKGLRVSLDGSMRTRAVETLYEFPRSWRMELEHVAVRGSRMSLSRQFYRDTDQSDSPITVEVFTVTECSEGDRVHTLVLFDPDDVDAAFEELDRRYVRSVPTQHADTWNVITRAYAGMTRGELPPTSPDLVNVDHRRVAPMGPDNGIAYLRASWDLAPKFDLHIEAVHRLTGLGAVFTRWSSGTSQEGFDAEWRAVDVVTVKGGLISRGEIFDESDLEAALTRFDELSRQTREIGIAPAQLDNTATRTRARIADEFNRRDMSAFLALVAPNGSFEDRRKGLRDQATGAGLGKLTQALFDTVPADWVFEVQPFAIRGSRLALGLDRYRTTGDDPTTTAEHLTLTEVDDDDLACRTILFDPDDLDAAFEELDARYGAGEGSAHARTWALIAHSYATFSRHEMPATTPNWVNIDHRRAAAFAPGDLGQYVRAAWSVTPDTKAHIQTVHRLNSQGAVLTVSTYGTSPQGFHAEWQDIHLATFDGGLCDRFELFDEADLDAALAKFNELSTAASQLQNAATRANLRVIDAFNRRDIDGLASTWGARSRYDDRRKGLRDEGRLDQEYARELMRDTPGSWRMEADVLGIRGRRLALARQMWRDASEPDLPVAVELLAVLTATDDEKLYQGVFFDPGDINAAFAELDARWVGSGECAHPEVVEAVRVFTETANRHEWDELVARHAGATYTNHRQLRSGADTVADDMSSLRALTSLVPDLSFETTEFLVHSEIGVVVHTVAKGTSTEDVPIEVPFVILMLIDGDRITHAETYDLDQREQALARFDELSAGTPARRTAVARVLARVVDAFERRDPERYLALFADDCRYEDRRKGLRDAGSIRPDYAQTVTFGAAAGWQAEFESIAVRGEHLMLGRATFRDQSEAGSPIAVEALNVGRLNDDEMISWFAVFDPDDIDTAFGELTAQWVASGEVTHPEAIEAAQQLFEVTNRHDWGALAARESGATFVNHRQLGTGEVIGDHWSSLRTMASLIPDMRVDVIEIPRHSAIGLVTNLVVRGTTEEGTAIELPAVIVLLFDKLRVTRMEAFDLNQREQALTRFDELNQLSP